MAARLRGQVDGGGAGRDLDAARDAAPLEEVGREVAEPVREALEVVVPRVDRPDRVAERVDDSARRLADLREEAGRLARGVEVPAADLREDRDAREARADVVVEVRREARPHALDGDGVPHALPVDEERGERHEGERRHEELRPPPERRKDAERRRGFGTRRPVGRDRPHGQAVRTRPRGRRSGPWGRRSARSTARRDPRAASGRGRGRPGVKLGDAKSTRTLFSSGASVIPVSAAVPSSGTGRGFPFTRNAAITARGGGDAASGPGTRRETPSGVPNQSAPEASRAADVTRLFARPSAVVKCACRPVAGSRRTTPRVVPTHTKPAASPSRQSTLLGTAPLATSTRRAASVAAAGSSTRRRPAFPFAT